MQPGSITKTLITFAWVSAFSTAALAVGGGPASEVAADAGAGDVAMLVVYVLLALVVVGGGIMENRHRVVTGLLVLSSVFVVISAIFPVHIRWRDALPPF